jgi:membrane protease subunit HflC
VIVRTYMTWRIADPLKFYVTLKDPAEARRQLASQLREVRGIIGEYRLDELVNENREQLALDEIEEKARLALERTLSDAGFGLDVETFGISRIILPESTTAKVFETMIATRERLAESALQEGQAQASAIRSEAESARDRILAFADRRAQAIRSQGDREASVEYEGFARNEEFAIFLRRLEALEKMLKHNTTFVLSAEALGILDWLDQKPPSRTGGGRTP